MPQEWKESIIVPIHKKGDRVDCNNYRGISLFLTSYKILSNILLSRMTLYANEVIGECQCGFRRNRSSVNHIQFRVPKKVRLIKTFRINLP